MRVECVKIINPVNGQQEAEHPSIRIGHRYTVLEIYVEGSDGTTFRVRTSDGSPGLWGSSMFVAVDDNIPESWSVKLEEKGHLIFGPTPWLEASFWERYFDDEPEAVAVYKSELAKLVEGEN